MFLETAEAAEQDAFMRDFVMKRVGGNEAAAAGLIQDFRKWREARGKKGPPSDPAEFVKSDKHKS